MSIDIEKTDGTVRIHFEDQELEPLRQSLGWRLSHTEGLEIVSDGTVSRGGSGQLVCRTQEAFEVVLEHLKGSAMSGLASCSPFGSQDPADPEERHQSYCQLLNRLQSMNPPFSRQPEPESSEKQDERLQEYRQAADLVIRCPQPSDRASSKVTVGTDRLPLTEALEAADVLPTAAAMAAIDRRRT